MSRVARKRMHRNNREIIRRSRTRARVKDLDQIHDDLANPDKVRVEHDDPDLPGGGQFYCMECARHFMGEPELAIHRRGKLHKRRLTKLRADPYTQKEAELAAGLKTDNGVRSAQALAASTASQLAVQATSAKALLDAAQDGAF